MKAQTCSLATINRASGIFDIALMLPFAIPGVAGWVILQIQAIHEALSLSGSMPEFSPFHLMFVNLMACITIVWSVLRVMNPSVLYGIYDTIVRLIIIIIMLVYLLAYDVSQIIWLFVLLESGWAAFQINGYVYKRQSEDENPNQGKVV